MKERIIAIVVLVVFAAVLLFSCKSEKGELTFLEEDSPTEVWESDVNLIASKIINTPPNKYDVENFGTYMAYDFSYNDVRVYITHILTMDDMWLIFIWDKNSNLYNSTKLTKVNEQAIKLLCLTCDKSYNVNGK